MHQLIPILILFVVLAQIQSSASQEKPDIFLSYFIGVYDLSRLPTYTPEFKNNPWYNNSLIFRNGSEFTALQNVSQIHFVCEASYPVKWNFPLPQQFANIRGTEFETYVERISEYNENLKEPRNSKFVAHLHLTLGYKFIGGNMTCESAQDSIMQSGIYLFTEGRIPIQGKFTTFKVNMTENTEKVILPCRPSLPEFRVSLFKENRIGLNITQWIPMPLNGSIYFDPCIGFTLDRKSLATILGIYKCALDGNNDMYAMADVTLGEKVATNEYNFVPRKILNTNADRVVVNKNLTFGCCSGKSPFVGSSFSCITEAQCNIYKSIMAGDIMTGKELLQQRAFYGSSNSLCFIETMKKNSMLLVCQSPDMDVNVQLLKVFNDITTPEEKSFLPKNIMWTERRVQLMDMSTSESVKVEQKMQIRIASPMLNHKFRGNFLQSRNRTRYILYSAEYSTSLKTDPSGNEDINTKYLEEHTGPTINEGESLYVICFNLRYFYAQGGWLQLNWKNGTKTLLQNEYNIDNDDVNYMGKAPETNHAILGYIPVADVNMASVDCFAPVWNTVHWDKYTFQFNIGERSS